MAAARISPCVAMAAAVAATSTLSNKAYADSPFRFPFFSSSSSSSNPSPQADQSSDTKSESQAADDPKKSGFDPEALEKGAKALREINSSPYAKQVFSLVLEFNLIYFDIIGKQKEMDKRKKFLQYGFPSGMFKN